MPPYPGLPSPVLTPDELAVVALEVGWPTSDIPQFVAIEINQDAGEGAAAWNNTDPNGGSIGEPQINGVHAPGGELTPAFAREMSDPANAASEALQLFDVSGWQPWTGDPSLGPAQTNLATGQQALADVEAVPSAELTSWYSGAENVIRTGLGIAGELAPTIASGGVSTGVAAGVAAGNAPGSIASWALKIGAGLVGGTLLILGVYQAAKPDHDESSQHPILSTAAKGALA